MKYYEMHEDAYKDLKDKGFISWDRMTKANELFNHSINRSLKKNIDKFFPTIEGRLSLDLGTGTGTVALFLANLGFKSFGHDISQTAIEMAKINAQSLGLDVCFEVNDINQSKTDKTFDLIVDSSFFHCVVLNNDRKHCYNFVNESLNSQGKFFLHTMIQSEDMTDFLSAPHILLEDDILWSTGPKRWDIEWKLIQGKEVFPHRRILTLENLKKELRNAGLTILEEDIIENKRHPSVYTAWLQRT